MTSRDTSARRWTSADDGCGTRGCNAPVFIMSANACSDGGVHPVYVRLPNARIPTPYSGSHRISDPKPGSPPLCAMICAKSQLPLTPRPKP